MNVKRLFDIFLGVLIFIMISPLIIIFCIIIYFYEGIPCSISVLNNTVNISRTALTRIINDSIEEKWLFSKINKENKRQTLILPTELRINFWLLYCKSKYEKSKLAGLADAHKALYHYDANIKNYLKNNK